MGKRISRVLDAFAGAFGYVPESEVTAAAVRCEAEIAALVEEASRHRHENQNLRHQLAVKNRLENEIEFLRKAELARIETHAVLDNSVRRLEDISVNLTRVMEERWPDWESTYAGDREAAAA